MSVCIRVLFSSYFFMLVDSNLPLDVMFMIIIIFDTNLALSNLYFTYTFFYHKGWTV
jgi:hypothetical protein